MQTHDDKEEGTSLRSAEGNPIMRLGVFRNVLEGSTPAPVNR